MSITPEATGDGRVAYPASRWAALSEFEKCLFWWTEINRHALNLKRSFPETAWCSGSYAELLLDKNPHIIGRLLEFLRLPTRESFIQDFGAVVDAHEKKTTAAIDDSALDRYPDALAIMRELGFERDADGLRSYIDRRYRTTSLANWFARKIEKARPEHKWATEIG